MGYWLKQNCWFYSVSSDKKNELDPDQGLFYDFTDSFQNFSKQRSQKAPSVSKSFIWNRRWRESFDPNNLQKDKNIKEQPFNWVPKFFCGNVTCHRFEEGSSSRTLIFVARKSALNPGLPPHSRCFDNTFGDLAQHWEIEAIQESSDGVISSQIFNFADLPLTIEQQAYKGDISVKNDEKSIQSRSSFLKKYFASYEGVNQLITLPIHSDFKIGNKSNLDQPFSNSP